MAISRLSLVKFLELAITIICLALHYHTFTARNQEELLVITGTFAGYIIILIGGFAGHLMSTPIAKRIDMFFSLVGCALFVASGALSIQYFENTGKGSYRDKGLAKASMAIINGCFFLFDALLTWRGEF